MADNFSQLFQSEAHTLACKRTMLRQAAGDLETLVVGSSHGDFGFDPQHFPGSFNLCNRSQDLRHSAAIYKRVATSLPRLRNVVVFYSVFSPGFVLERNPTERDICLALHEVLDLTLDYDEPALSSRTGSFKSRLAGWQPTAEGRWGFLPHHSKTFFADSYGAERRAQEHLRFNHGAEGLFYLASMLLAARRNQHNVLVVLSPARSDMRAACNLPDARLLRGLRSIEDEMDLRGAFRILNLWGHPSLRDEHFGDFDHLKPTGDGPGIVASAAREALSARA